MYAGEWVLRLFVAAESAIAVTRDFMEKDLASRIVKAAVALDAQIGELDGLISRLSDEEEKAECVKALGDVIGIIAKHFVFRITRQYPDLNPDR
jgi:hypothetical protein